MLHVCHVISGDLWAGAEVMASHLLRELGGRQDFRLSVILLNEGRLARELRAAEVPVRVFDEGKNSFLQILAKTRAEFCRHPPQVVHSHRYKENILAWFSLSGGSPCRLVATQHGMAEGASGRIANTGKYVDRLNRYLLGRHFDQLVAVSEDVGDRLIGEFGFPRTRVSVIHNGIAVPSRVSGPPAGATPVVGSAGRLAPVKDYRLMVEIGRILLERQESLTFELAGDGPERPALEERIATGGLADSFLLRGEVDDLDSFYRRLHVYLNTSLHEGLPLSVLEAMAHGVPVVAPRVGGLEEILTDGVEGFLVEGRDPRRYAEKCLLLARDHGLRAAMGAAARKKVREGFSCQAMADAYSGLYLALASGTNANRRGVAAFS